MKKVKVCASLCISREVEVEVDDEEYNEDDLYNSFVSQIDLPMGVYEYDNKDPEAWLVDDLTVVEVK